MLLATRSLAVAVLAALILGGLGRLAMPGSAGTPGSDIHHQAGSGDAHDVDEVFGTHRLVTTEREAEPKAVQTTGGSS